MKFSDIKSSLDDKARYVYIVMHVYKTNGQKNRQTDIHNVNSWQMNVLLIIVSIT